MNWCPVCHQKTQDIRIKGLEIKSNKIIYKGRPLKLAPSEMNLLLALAKRYPEHSSTDAICLYMWPQGRSDNKGPDENLIKVHISHMRKKFDKIGLGIACVWGKGYKLILSDIEFADEDDEKLVSAYKIINYVEKLSKSMLDSAPSQPAHYHFQRLRKIVGAIDELKETGVVAGPPY